MTLVNAAVVIEVVEAVVSVATLEATSSTVMTVEKTMTDLGSGEEGEGTGGAAVRARMAFEEERAMGVVGGTL